MNLLAKTTAVLVALILFGTLSACSGPTPTAPPPISSAKAIEIAAGGCKIPHLVLQGEPQNIHAQLMTLQEADKLTADGGFTNYEIPLDSPVWLVQMDGMLLLVGGPPTIVPTGNPVVTPTPPQPFWGTCKVIINANTGNIIGVRG
jgi:hypothetical protein